MNQKSKDKILKLRMAMYRLEDKITKEADKAMEEEGVHIPHTSIITGETMENDFDDAQWFHISTEWECPESPFGWCMYHIIHDPAMDGCVFCGEPKERK